MSIHCLRLSLCSLPGQVNKSVSHWYEIELKISTPRYFEGQRYDLFRNDVLFLRFLWYLWILMRACTAISLDDEVVCLKNIAAGCTV